jgi:hypothetical protein
MELNPRCDPAVDPPILSGRFVQYHVWALDGMVLVWPEQCSSDFC